MAYSTWDQKPTITIDAPRRETFYVLNYSHPCEVDLLEDLIEQTFGKRLEILADMECRNDSCFEIDVDAERGREIVEASPDNLLNYHDQQSFDAWREWRDEERRAYWQEQGVSYPILFTEVVMCILAYLGKIPAGSYLFRISW